MRRYRYARFYCACIAVAAVITLFCSLAVFIYGIAQMRRYSSLVSIIRSQPLYLDTASLPEALSSAVNVLARAGIGVTNGIAPSPSGFSLDNYAALSEKEALAFESYVRAAKLHVTEMKRALTADFEGATADLLQAANNMIEAQRGDPRGARDSATATARLFSPGAITNRQLSDLDEIARILQNDVILFTPSAAAHEAGRKASSNLKVLLRVMMQDAKVPSEQETNAATKTHESRTMRHVSDFRSLLLECRSGVQRLLAESWVVDHEIDKCLTTIENHHSIREPRLSSYSLRKTAALVYACFSLFCGAMLALILMVIRDFLLAMVDTATDTSAIRTRLEAISFDVS